MITIEQIDPARTSFSDYVIDGTTVVIGGITVDLEAEEGDQEVIISFGSGNGTVHRGIRSDCVCVADIIIPPRKYKTVEIPKPPAATDEEEGGEDERYTELQALPLDVDSVIVRLWPVVDESSGEALRSE